MLLLPIFKKNNLKFIAAIFCMHSICIWVSKGKQNAGLMISQFLYFHFDAQLKKKIFELFKCFPNHILLTHIFLADCYCVMS